VVGKSPGAVGADGGDQPHVGGDQRLLQPLGKRQIETVVRRPPELARDPGGAGEIGPGRMKGDDRSLERKGNGFGFLSPELTPSDLLP
jgi:hypothetical protein